MKEAFLHYIWQHQLFKKPLISTRGRLVTVISPGSLHTNAGPDFTNAQLIIDELTWAGPVEIHLKSSDWYRHKHHHDRAYDNIILHVVWEEDKPVALASGELIETVSLKGLVDISLQENYKELVNSILDIPCQYHLPHIPEVIRRAAIDKVVVERLYRKSSEIDGLLRSNRGNWEETIYQMLARSFGFKINSDPFLQLAKLTPYKLVLQNVHDLGLLESLFFGQAGFLNEVDRDAYALRLKEQYAFLKHKHNLVGIEVHRWKFLRLRPANFPTVRIAQLAALLHKVQHLFSWLIHSEDLTELLVQLKVEQSEYWQTHYHFDKSTRRVAGLGKSSVNGLAVNLVAPTLMAYGRSTDNQILIDRSLHLLESVSPEHNSVVNRFIALDWKPESALDSQGLIELHNSYCRKRKCLSCVIGNKIIRP